MGARELLSGSQLFNGKSSNLPTGTVHYWNKVPWYWSWNCLMTVKFGSWKNILSINIFMCIACVYEFFVCLKLQKVQKQERIQQHCGRVPRFWSCSVLTHIVISQCGRSQSQVQNMKGFRVEELINISTSWEAYGRNAADLGLRYLSGITNLSKVLNENLHTG